MDLSNAYATLGADIMATSSIWLLVLVGLAAVVIDSFKNDHPSLPILSLLAIGGAFVVEVVRLHEPAGATAFYGLIRTGGYASFVNMIVLLAAGLSVELCRPYLARMKHNYGEVYAIVLFATAGMMVLGAATNLVTVFVGLETMSICLYILTGLVRDDEGGIESALKYFLLGAFSTGFFLYGMALIYGSTGSFYLTEIAAASADGGSVIFWAGVGLLLVGFLFKVSAVPFHMWTPDVYQGAPTTLTGFMSTASKAAAFGSLILVLYLAMPDGRWTSVLAIVALITMVLGNLLAIAQTNVKRMLAYSSIAHAGYVLVGLAAGTEAGFSGALFYLLVYTVMNIGAFGVMALLEWDEKEGRVQTLDSLAGVGYRKPLLGWTMAFFMFSLSGFPPLGGFMGKVAVFAPAIDSGLTWLAIVGVLASAISAYYYLRVIVVFFMKAEDDVRVPVSQNSFPVPSGSAAVLILCAVLLVVLGVYPQILDLTAVYFHTHVATALVP